MDVIIWIWIAVIVIIIGLMIWYLTKGETKISEEGGVQEGETPKEESTEEPPQEGQESQTSPEEPPSEGQGQ